MGESKKAPKYKELAIKILLPGFVLFLLLALSALNENLVQKFSQWFSIFPTPGVGIQVETQSPFVKHESVPPGRWEMEVAGPLTGRGEFVFLAALFVNVNKFSLHGMYKSRLIRAYLGASRKKQIDVRTCLLASIPATIFSSRTYGRGRCMLSIWR